MTPTETQTTSLYMSASMIVHVPQTGFALGRDLEHNSWKHSLPETNHTIALHPGDTVVMVSPTEDGQNALEILSTAKTVNEFKLLAMTIGERGVVAEVTGDRKMDFNNFYHGMNRRGGRAIVASTKKPTPVFSAN